jgi:hypothetical protein
VGEVEFANQAHAVHSRDQPAFRTRPRRRRVSRLLRRFWRARVWTCCSAGCVRRSLQASRAAICAGCGCWRQVRFSLAHLSTYTFSLSPIPPQHVHFYERYVPYNSVTGKADHAAVSADGSVYTNPAAMVRAQARSPVPSPMLVPVTRPAAPPRPMRPQPVTHSLTPSRFHPSHRVNPLSPVTPGHHRDGRKRRPRGREQLC